jgi:hypothetical protein
MLHLHDRGRWLAWGFGVALVVSVAGSARAAGDTCASSSQPSVSFAGEWRTTFGVMTLMQSGEAIRGEYGGPPHGTLEGKLEGRRFTFTYNEADAAGEGWFELAGDGQTFKGRWREKGAAQWSDWEGRLTASANSFTGLWKTTFGRMRLRQTGDAVRGIYEFNGIAQLSGTVKEGKLHFRYEQSDGERGEGTFELAGGGEASAFAGTWRASQRGSSGGVGSGEWSGQRLRPQRGITFLVVLEANWEHDLAEPEYSFGLMLRTFFARVPSVQVRHRFFGDEADFRRWCGEVAFLAEPVVLHISSHGSHEGVICGNGKPIGADVLADCLKDMGDVRLVHFGTCLLAGGEIPMRIHRSLAEDGVAASFPISGYVNTADWGGSAIVDFTYLELVLSRGMNPVEAVRQTKKMLTFARAEGEANDAIAPAGLVVFEPQAQGAKEVSR